MNIEEEMKRVDPCPDVELILRCAQCDLMVDVAPTFHMSEGIMAVCRCPRVIWVGATEPEGLETMFKHLEAAQEAQDG